MGVTDIHTTLMPEMVQQEFKGICTIKSEVRVWLSWDKLTQTFPIIHWQLLYMLNKFKY